MVNVIRNIITFVNIIKIIMLLHELKNRITFGFPPIFFETNLYLADTNTNGKSMVKLPFLLLRRNLKFFFKKAKENHKLFSTLARKLFKKPYSIN